MFYTTVERHDEALNLSPGPQPPCTVGIGVTKTYVVPPGRHLIILQCTKLHDLSFLNFWLL